MKKLVAIIIASFVTMMAYSATLCYTNSYSGYTDFVQDIAIPQFNPSIGNLRSVIVQAQIIENRTFAAENRSAADQVFTFQMINTIKISIPNSTDSKTNIYTSNVPARRLVRSYDRINDFSGASGFTINVNTTNAIPIILTNISQFTGYSVIPVQACVVGRMSWSFSGGSYSSYTQDIVDIRIFVQYTYDPIYCTR